MIYVKENETGRTVEMPDDIEIPDGWTRVDTVLCAWCNERPFDEKHNDWFLTIVYGYRYCSEECKLAHVQSRLRQ